jgi:DNA-binding transcriptional regulator GbsR (MarR family)
MQELKEKIERELKKLKKRKDSCKDYKVWDEEAIACIELDIYFGEIEDLIKVEFVPGKQK